MSENSGVDNPPEKIRIEKAGKPDVASPRIYNLPDKVAGIERRLEEIDTDEHTSPKAFLKKTRKLNNKCLWLSKNAKLNEQIYNDRFGEVVIKKVRQDLEELPGKIKAAKEQKAGTVMAKTVSGLSKAGYSH